MHAQQVSEKSKGVGKPFVSMPYYKIGRLDDNRPDSVLTKYFSKKDYEKAFLTFGDSAFCFNQADEAMKQAEYGVWEDFYKNDCLADVRYTCNMIRKIMGVMRELGDSVYHDSWQRKYGSEKENQDVVLLMFTERYMTDWEIYQAMKRRRADMNQ